MTSKAAARVTAAVDAEDRIERALVRLEAA